MVFVFRFRIVSAGHVLEIPHGVLLRPLMWRAAIYVSIGVFSSSLTENQIIAFLIALILWALLLLRFQQL